MYYFTAMCINALFYRVTSITMVMLMKLVFSLLSVANQLEITQVGGLRDLELIPPLPSEPNSFIFTAN